MTGATPSSRRVFGHPAGLAVLFFTEMWERFSFYGMRALLIYYMTKHLLLEQQAASHLYGLYCGLVYFTPLLGGWLADRYLGQHRCVVLGGLLMAMGHFLMIFEPLFFPALGLLILGNGAFKPNISAQVGGLYPRGDSRRDRAFSIFYVGINLGAFLAPLVCGYLGERFGWDYGFGAAGVGMLLGLGVYLAGGRLLPRGGKAERKPATLAARGEENTRLLGLVAVCLVVVLFWAVFEQQGNTMALWADADTDRHILGWEMPATWFQSFNPFFIFLLTPLLTRFWSRLSRSGREPSSVGKMVRGLFFTAAASALMVYPASLYDVDGTPVSMLWLIGFTLVLTLGELYLSPVGLSLVTKLAPGRFVSLCLGVWFLSQFAGNLMAGALGGLWNSVSSSLFFALMSGIACLGGLVLLWLGGFLRRSLAR